MSSETGKRNADRLNMIGVVVVGICGAVLTYVSIALLQAFYMDDTEQVESAILVPTQAVVQSGDRASVWVVGPEGTAAIRPVDLGQRTAERIEILQGLAPGDAVIVEGLARLRPGVAVQAVAEITAR